MRGSVSIARFVEYICEWFVEYVCAWFVEYVCAWFVEYVRGSLSMCVVR